MKHSKHSSKGKLSETKVDEVANTIKRMREEIGKVFFGQEAVVNSLIRALLCDGHVLLEGIPGIAKTLAIKALAQVSGCSSKRIQFTVDLLPSDITGLTTYDSKKGFEVVKGPIFANFIIADEINRSPAKTQSALIEAMQEKHVTIGGRTFELPKPFFVMANQNPIENEGVYSLPEAQVDRFLFKVLFGYPKMEEEKRIMGENTTFKRFEDFHLRAIVNQHKIIEMQKLVHDIYIDEKIKTYIFNIVNKTRLKDFKMGTYIDLGASPRASIALFIAAKAEAMMNGRNYVIPQDVRVVAMEVLRHRLILSYKARADGIIVEHIIEDIFKLVNVP